MALLNPPEILPPLIRSVVEAAAASDRPVDEDRLIELLSPGEDGQNGSIGVSEKRHVRYSRDAAQMLGLLEETGGGSVPTEAVRAAMSRGSLRPAWPQVLRRAVFEHQSAPKAVVEAVREDTRGVRDLLFALTWFLSQDALGAPLGWEPHERYSSFQTLQRVYFGAVTTRHPVQNDTRFGSFERWSLHLGLAQSDELGHRALRPAPISAARDAVRSLEPGRYEVQRFCAVLSEALPCLWPGYLREQLAEIMGSDPDPDVSAEGIDSSVTLVLVTLEAEGRLRMENLADASQRGILAPRSEQPRTVTHVEVLA
jgi:hypothetical protein